MGARPVILVMAALGSSGLALAGLALATSCTEPFFAAANGGSGTGGTPASTGTGERCDTAHPDQCGADAFCVAPSCSGAGRCAPASAGTGDFTPLCGCNGVTYWNAPLAIAAKATVRRVGACGGGGETCDAGSSTCETFGPRGFCSVMVDGGGACPLPTSQVSPKGTCWVLPPECAGTSPTGYACMDPGHCKTACALVEAQLAWWEAPCAP